MFERFTDRARRALVLAEGEARDLGHGYIGTEHLLLGLIGEMDGIGAKALESLGISSEAVRKSVVETIGPATTASTEKPPFTPRAKKVLELSLREALQLGHNYIGTEHLLLGIVREGEGVGAHVLVNLGADLSRVRQRVVDLLKGAEHEGATLRVSASTRVGAAYDIGTRLTFEVVRAGRRPADSVAAFETMGQILRDIGIDINALEPSEVTITSVTTSEGPGLRLVVDHLVQRADEQPPQDPGEGAAH